MMQFKRYPHIADLIEHYIEQTKRTDIESIYMNGIKTERDADLFCKFIWDIVAQIHLDSEEERTVLGNLDNTDMLPDLAYEVTQYMKAAGYYSTWEKTLSD